MENASKALLMAAGVLLSLIVIGSLLLLANNLTTYQESADAQTESQQIAEFNSQYTYYNRSDVRGNEIISLTNKILDYNSRKGQEGFTEMHIEIENIDTNALLYDNNDSNKIITQDRYDETTIANIRNSAIQR